MERNDQGGSTPPATSSTCVGSQGAFTIAEEKRRGAPIPNVQNQYVVAPLSTAGDPLVPQLQGNFRDSLGFVGAREPVCAGGSPARPPGLPLGTEAPVAVPGAPVRVGPTGAYERI